MSEQTPGEIVPFKAKRRPFPIPTEAATVLSTLGAYLSGVTAPAMGADAAYSLRRCKQGTEVWFHLGKFSWNVSAMLDVWPASFRDARAWIAAYAVQHGQEVAAKPVPRWPRGSREDYALLRAGGCKESWLASDVPTLAAEAAWRCRHPLGDCARDGMCAYGTCDMAMDVPVPAPAEEAADA